MTLTPGLTSIPIGPAQNDSLALALKVLRSGQVRPIMNLQPYRSIQVVYWFTSKISIFYSPINCLKVVNANTISTIAATKGQNKPLTKKRCRFVYLTQYWFVQYMVDISLPMVYTDALNTLGLTFMKNIN